MSRIPSHRIVAAVSLVLSPALAAGAQEGSPPVPVQVGYALEQGMAPHTWVPGTVMSRNTAAIASEVSGQLTWVADVGERIEAGQPVARINDQSLQLQLKNDEATIKRLEAQLKYLEQQAERTRRLTEQQVAPANDLEQVEAQLEAVRQELVQAKVGRERTHYELDRTSVKAPFTGEVVERLQQPGSFSGIGEEIVQLVDTGNVEARAQAPLAVAPYLSEGRSRDGSDRSCRSVTNARECSSCGFRSERRTLSSVLRSGWPCPTTRRDEWWPCRGMP